MTKDEIKQQYSMLDILARYSLEPNRTGFIKCPFHNEKSASMKIYRDSYYCFGCGANGDIFTFVQLLEGVSFKEAFNSLGGTYSKPTFESNLALYRSRKRREMKRKEEERLNEERQLNNLLIGAYQKGLEQSRPLSEAWCDNYNALQFQLYKHGEINNLDLRW